MYLMYWSLPYGFFEQQAANPQYHTAHAGVLQPKNGFAHRKKWVIFYAEKRIEKDTRDMA